MRVPAQAFLIIEPGSSYLAGAGSLAFATGAAGLAAGAGAAEGATTGAA